MQGTIKIALKYDENKQSVIRKIERVSKPGLRKYVSSSEMPRILNSLGVAIVSTSKGVMTADSARKQNFGGEIICTVE